MCASYSPIVSFLVTGLREMSYQTLRASIKLLIIHFALSPGMDGRLMVTWTNGNIFFPELPGAKEQLFNATSAADSSGDWGVKRSVTSAELFKLKDVQ